MTSNNFRIIAVNDADEAVLTTTATTYTSLPVTNVQLLGRSRVMRTTSTLDFSILGTFPYTRFLSGVSLARHNFTIGATFRLICYSGDDQTGDILYDSGIISAVTALGWGVFEWGLQPWGSVIGNEYSSISTHWFDPVVTKSFEIQISNSDNPAGFIELGRLFLGYSVIPKYNISLNSTFEVVEDTKQVRTDGGTLRSEIGLPYRSISVDLPLVTDTDRQKLTTAFSKVGLRRDVLVSVFPNTGDGKELDYTMVGKFVKVPKYTEVAPNYFKTTLDFEEV